MVCDSSPKGNSINSPHSNSFATVIRRWRSVLSNIYRKTHCGSLIIKLQALYLPGSVNRHLQFAVKPPAPAIVSPVWSPVKYRAGVVAGLLRSAHFLLMKKSGRGRPLPLSNLLLKPYRLSVKVRAITSRCCSGVRELKRTA